MTQTTLTKERFIELCVNKVSDHFQEDFAHEGSLGGIDFQVMLMVAELNNQLKDQGKSFYKWKNSGRISKDFTRLRDEIRTMTNKVIDKCVEINSEIESVYA